MTHNRHLTLLKQDVKAWNWWRQENSKIDLDLSGTNLSNLNLSGVNLSGVNLSKVNFKGTNLKCAYLRGANLRQACLINADLSGSDLSEVELTEANLTEADLSSADLTNANLTKVNAVLTNFEKSILTGACLEDWQIDSNTNLEELVCDYFYGKQQKQQRYPRDIKQNFVPGEYHKFIRNNFNDLNDIDAIILANLNPERNSQEDNRHTLAQNDNLVEESIDDSWQEETDNLPSKLMGSSDSSAEPIKQKNSLLNLSLAFLLGILLTILTFGQLFRQTSTTNSSNNLINCDLNLLKQARDAIVTRDEASLKRAMEQLKEFNSPLGGFADEQCRQTLHDVKYIYAIHIKAKQEDHLLEAVEILCELPEQFYQERKHKTWFTEWINTFSDTSFPQQLTKYTQNNDCPAANYLTDN